MIKTSLPQRFLRLLRRIFNTEQIFQQQQHAHEQHHRLLLAVGNGLKSLSTDSEKIKQSIQYKRCAEMVLLLSPMDVAGAKYVRVGKDYDGGYIMLDYFHETKVEAAYSFGINDDISWDEAMANRGIEVFMYDHTIERLPKNHPKFHYFKEGVTGYNKGPCLKTLGELIQRNGHSSSNSLIMKMDTEGCEWDIFSEAGSSVINQFSQIAMEFHGLSSAIYDTKYPLVAAVLKRINETHQCVHVHANSTSIPLWIGELVLPSELEVTYVRRADVKDRLVTNTRQFPTEMDQPTYPGWPDIYLGDFSSEMGTRQK